MILTDVHTHSTFSTDGKSTLAEMVAAARDAGARYYGVSEHFDFDYVVLGLKIHGAVLPYTDADDYFAAIRAMQRKNDERFTLLAGGEYGFCPLPQCAEEYARLNETYSPDFVVNSVHTVDGHDCYFPDYFEGKEKPYAYSRYLEQVRKSLEVPYSYDIVAHLGYVSRNAPYEDKKLRYEEFPELIDDILRAVIAKDKILEVNSSSRGAGSDFLPDTDILERYFQLGGRSLSFASDAHHVSRVCAGREGVAAALKQIGFTHITVPCRGERIKVEI